MDELSRELKLVDDKVDKYRTTFEKTTNEAQRLKLIWKKPMKQLKLHKIL